MKFSNRIRYEFSFDFFFNINNWNVVQYPSLTPFPFFFTFENYFQFEGLNCYFWSNCLKFEFFLLFFLHLKKKMYACCNRKHFIDNKIEPKLSSLSTKVSFIEINCRPTAVAVFRYLLSYFFRMSFIWATSDLLEPYEIQMKKSTSHCIYLRRTHSLAGISPLILHLVYLQNKTIRTEVGQSAQEITPDWTIHFWLAEIFTNKIRILC